MQTPPRAGGRAASHGVSRLVLVALLFVAAGTLYVSLRYYAHYLDDASVELTELYRTYSHYLRDHDGELPDRFEDLVGGGYLREVTPGRFTQYRGPLPRDGEFVPVYDRNILEPTSGFRLHYGGSVNQLEVRDGSVYDRSTGREVVFVAPSQRSLMGLCRQLSVRVLQRFRELAPPATSASLPTTGASGGD